MIRSQGINWMKMYVIYVIIRTPHIYAIKDCEWVPGNLVKTCKILTPYLCYNSSQVRLFENIFTTWASNNILI